jgi:HTH-type transcriptional regulator / antitoxin HipB
MNHLLQTPSQLATHLRALRQGRGWTQAELGKRLGLSQARIARIEGTPLTVSVHQLLTVLAALGAQVSLVQAPPPVTLLKAKASPQPRATKAGQQRPTEPGW